MKKIVFVLLAVIIFLSACGQSTPVPVVDDVTPTPALTLTSTATLLPSATPTASITPLPTIPTFTPTFDVSTIVTVTPAGKAECPKTNPQAKLVLNEIPDYLPGPDEIVPPILEFLNQGGDVNTAIQMINQMYGRGEVVLAFFQDLTNDGMPEIVIKYPSMVVFKCQNGQYQIVYEGGGFTSYEILDDLNENGLPEIMENFFLFNSGIDIGLQEWDGSEFAEIGHLGIDGGSQNDITDWSGDGLSEVVFRGGAPGICCEADLNPWRYKTTIFGWNGNEYVEVYQFFDPPQFRFQAIQDADREILYGNTATALKLYQEGIFADNLDWWSSDKKHYTDEIIYHRWEQPKPTLAPAPNPDPAEYPRLAAYAYYRIILIHLAQGQESEAITTYQTLQQTFGDDPYAQPYVEMATAFWDAYQSAHRMYDGCAAAIQYAVVYPEILIPLGSDYHGAQSHIYVPADVCPFR